MYGSIASEQAAEAPANPAPALSPAAVSFADQALAVLAKDLRSEFRSRAAINSVLLFAITAMVVVAFAVGVQQPSASLKAALLWVVLFFAAFSGLAHTFVQEEEAGTVTALRLTASALAVYAGKLAFNLILLGLIGLVVAPVFAIMLDFHVERPFAFAITVACGCLGLGAGATAVAAIVSKAQGKGALFGALGFPILLPLLMLSVRATELSMTDAPVSKLAGALVGVVAFGIMLVTATGLVFPYIWEE